MLKKYGYKNILFDPKRKNKILIKMRMSREKNGNCLPAHLMQPFQRYKNKVYALTNKNKKDKFTEEELLKTGKCGTENALQVDHIVSVKEGFTKNIPPEIIADPENLRLINWKENDQKKHKSLMSIDELYFKINKKSQS